MKVITISREYGAGGHSVGMEVAKRLGVKFYDKDIVDAVAAKSGMDIESLEKTGEDISLRNRIMRSMSPNAYDPQLDIFREEAKVIVKLASEGPCVILGRCANIILREVGIETIDVFITADDTHRIKRVAELIGTDSTSVVLKEIRKKDISRRNFYLAATGHHWADCRDFHMILDSGLLGYDACVRAVVAAVQ